MPVYRTTRHVPHAPGRMFDLVADVEKYPEFLPLCEALTIKSRETGADGTQVLTADMAVGYKAFHERFATRVTLDQSQQRILVEYVDGPFRYLENRWTFETDGTGCAVGFYISYEFRSALLGLLMGTIFDRAFRKFAQAFEARADAIYGRA